MKRYVFKLALFLLFGAIVNVAVAWASTAWIDLPRGDDFKFISEIQLLPGTTVIEYIALDRQFGFVRVHAKISSQLNMETGVQNNPVAKSVIPKWVREIELGRIVIPEDYRVIIDARGWPLASLYTVVTLKGSYMYNKQSEDWEPLFDKVSWGLPLSNKDTEIYGNSMRVLPLRPIWPGFAINTVCFTVILWLLALATFIVRCRIRRHYNHCIKCGYDLCGTEHNACPECGNENISTI